MFEVSQIVSLGKAPKKWIKNGTNLQRQKLVKAICKSERAREIQREPERVRVCEASIFV